MSGPAPAARGYPAEITGRERPWALSSIPTARPLSCPPRPGRLEGVERGGGSARGLAGSNLKPSGPSLLCYMAGETAVGTGAKLWPRVCRSPGFEALPIRMGCQFVALQSGSKKRRRGARASALTTTAVTGWPGM